LQWDNPRELFSRGMSACVVPLTPASAELSSLHVHQSPSGDALPPVHLAADASARSGVTRLSHLVTAVGMPLNGNGSTSVEVFTSARNTTIPANDDMSFSASATTSGSLVCSLSAGTDWVSVLSGDEGFRVATGNVCVDTRILRAWKSLTHRT
jgi:hypothetical protein